MFDHPLPSPGDPSISADFLRELAELADRTILGSGVMSSRLGTSVAQAMAFGSRQEVGLFELAATLSPGGSAAAYNVIWDGTGYVADTASGTALVYDVLGCFSGAAGDWGFAWQGPDSTNNQVLYMWSAPPQVYNAAASTAPAYGCGALTGVHGTLPSVVPQIDKPSSTYRKDYVLVGDADILTTEVGKYQSTPIVKALYNSGTPAVGELWGPTEGQWYLSKGSTGNGDSNTTTTRADWAVVVTGIFDSINKILTGKVVPYGMAKRCRGKLTGALTTTTASIAVDEITTISQGWCPVSASTDTKTVYNVYTTKGFAGPNNGVCQFEWNEAQSRWEFYDVECT